MTPVFAPYLFMTLADRVTTVRVILAPLFFALYALPRLMPHVAGWAWTVPVLWLFFIVSEISDMVDGQIARRMKAGSDFGKLYDPFADTITQLTYFLCFVMDGVFPAALYLVVIYREFGILFVRNLMLRKGVTMGARMTGKLKTVTYILAGATALLAISFDRLGLQAAVKPCRTAALIVFCISILFSIGSFIDYIKVYRATK
jgi:CDP-diacylglycerol--glycerol-3-phosphate 3-phosphatidyltransferase